MLEVDRFAILRPGEPEPDGLLPIWLHPNTGPQRVWGMGWEEATREMLLVLPEHMDGDLVLDAGTGTGILAIAAARLGADSVTAIDIDGPAVDRAMANVGLNDLDGRIRIIQADVLTHALPVGTFDVLLSNLYQPDDTDRLLIRNLAPYRIFTRGRSVPEVTRAFAATA